MRLKARSLHATVLLAGGLSAIGSLPVFLSPGIPGYDASSHVAKAAFFTYSLSHGNLLGWSQFWYSGFQMFYTYSPLTYVLAGGLGWPFDSAITGMRILIVASFVVSGIGAFALARDFGLTPNWSLAAALLYSLASPHVLILFNKGSLTYSLAFMLAPFLFLSARTSLREHSLGSTFSFGALLALMLVSNATTVYVLSFPFLAYFLVSIPRVRALKSAVVIGGSTIIALLLSGFWLIPYLEINLTGQADLLTESATGAYPGPNVIHWYSLFAPSLGNANAGDLGWMLLLPALASVVFIRGREEFALLAAVIASTLLTVGASLTPLFYRIPLVLALQFAWRFLVADVLFMAPLAALFFLRLSVRLSANPVFATSGRKIVAVSFILLVVLVSALTVPTIATISPRFFQGQQTPSDPNQLQAFNFLASKTGFFRVMVADRYYESFPQYTLKGSIDGWYDQATTEAYRNFTYNIYFCGANARTLGGLELLGTRYVLIDYGYGGDATGELQAFNSSGSVFGSPVFHNSEIDIYQVPDSHLVYVSESIPNSNFSLSQDVNCKEPIPTAPTQLNYTLTNLNWGEARISFDLEVNQSSYVLVSNSYAAGWVSMDNGRMVPVITSAPGLPVIHVSRGVHHIVLSYSGPPYAKDSAILSSSTLLALAASISWRRGQSRRPQHVPAPHEQRAARE